MRLPCPPGPPDELPAKKWRLPGGVIMLIAAMLGLILLVAVFSDAARGVFWLVLMGAFVILAVTRRFTWGVILSSVLLILAILLW
jgi:hypothetical protein